VGALAAATISTEIRDDEGHAFINRLSERYVWAPYLRPGPREIFVITPGSGPGIHGAEAELPRRPGVIEGDTARGG